MVFEETNSDHYIKLIPNHYSGRELTEEEKL
jgi:hypothetical protein